MNARQKKKKLEYRVVNIQPGDIVLLENCRGTDFEDVINQYNALKKILPKDVNVVALPGTLKQITRDELIVLYDQVVNKNA